MLRHKAVVYFFLVWLCLFLLVINFNFLQTHGQVGRADSFINPHNEDTRNDDMTIKTARLNRFFLQNTRTSSGSAPKITKILTSPYVLTEHDYLTIYAQVSDVDNDIAFVVVEYSLDTDSPTYSDMYMMQFNPQSGYYEATLPFTAWSTLWYRIKVQDSQGLWSRSSPAFIQKISSFSMEGDWHPLIYDHTSAVFYRDFPSSKVPSNSVRFYELAPIRDKMTNDSYVRVRGDAQTSHIVSFGMYKRFPLSFSEPVISSRGTIEVELNFSYLPYTVETAGMAENWKLQVWDTLPLSDSITTLPTPLAEISYRENENNVSWYERSESLILPLADYYAQSLYLVFLIEDSNNNDLHQGLVIDWDSSLRIATEARPLDVAYEYGATGNFLTWTAYDFDPTTYKLYKNNTPIASGTWQSGVPLTFNVDGLNVGEWNFTLVVEDQAHHTTVDEVLVTVYDSSPPLIQPQQDVAIELGTTGHMLSWTVSDNAPDHYRIYLNSTMIEEGSWNNTTPIILSLDGLARGSYNYTLLVTDKNNNTATDEVLVRVQDTTAPSVTHPADLVYEYGTTGHTLTWTLADLDPAYYVLYLNTTVVANTTWVDGQHVSLSVDGLTIGVYEYRILVYDASGNSARDNVFVTVIDTTAPQVSSSPPHNVTAELGLSLTMQWTATDLLPSSYYLFINGSLYTNGTWTSNVPVNVTLPTGPSGVVGRGIYNLTMLFYDVGMNKNASTVYLTVQDTMAPVIHLQPADTMTVELGNENVTLRWQAADVAPSTYRLYLNDSVFLNGTWQTNSTIVVPVNTTNLGLGIFNYTIVFGDTSNNTVVDTVLVTVVDTTAPSLSAPSDITYELGSVGNSIVWYVVDNSVANNNTYTVYVNTSFYTNGTWQANATITVNIDGFAVGHYNLTLVVWDTSNNSAHDEVVVTVQDTTPPILSHPDDIIYQYGTYGHTINWSVTEYSEFDYLVIRWKIDEHGHLKDRRVIDWGTINGSGTVYISVNVDRLRPGHYNYTLFTEDRYAQGSFDTVEVIVYPKGWGDRSDDETDAESLDLGQLLLVSTGGGTGLYSIYTRISGKKKRT